MIRLIAVHIEEFRGIRSLDLTPDGKSFVVWGPNGSGKSGVVDAIDFCLTGSVARLSGAGTGGVTLSRHGPHVHRRDDPGAAKVALTIADTATGQVGVLTRGVSNPGHYELEPSTPELREAVERIQAHPEITLSRREIIKYVITEPGERSKQVQALLKLDRIESTRKLLGTARNKCSSVLKSADGQVKTAEDALMRHLDMPSLLTEQIAEQINSRREVLGLPALGDFDISTDLSSGLESLAAASGFDKAAAQRDVLAALSAVAGLEELKAAMASLSSTLAELDDDPQMLASLRQRSFVEAGLDLVDDATCPLCDVSWADVETLRGHLRAKLARAEAAAQLEQRILAASVQLAQATTALHRLIAGAESVASRVDASEHVHRATQWIQTLVDATGGLRSVDDAIGQKDALESLVGGAPAEVVTDLEALRDEIEAKPDQTAMATARGFLTVAQERWSQVRTARAERAKAAAARAAGNAVYDAFCSAADELLTSLYATVESEFSEYYRMINPDDEAAFKAQLQPSAGKLDLAVDFHGLGMFPPAAYHSEGHQDGMGVCLYLALMKQMLGDDFRLAVLDDVVMSVDSNHRNQFCQLLTQRFPDVQFVITTHDAVWARQMQSAGLAPRKSQVRFTGWSVEGGPVYQEGSDVWSLIDADLEKDDAPAAAHKLRRHLEGVASDIAEYLRAEVPYRADARHDFGELVRAIKTRHKQLLKKALAAAGAWADDAAQETARNLDSERTATVPTQEDESWAVNILIHNNDAYASMTAADFAPVLAATRDFLGLFMCSNDACDSWIQLVGAPGADDSLRCNCGKYNLNLRGK